MNTETEAVKNEQPVQTAQTVPELPPVKNVTEAIEAILFAAGYPVKYAKLSEVLGLDEGDVRNLVENMAGSYNAELSGRGICLLTFPDSCQLATKECYLPYIREALGIMRGGNLSASSMEVLAIVAYNQPVTRAYVDAVRGVDSSYAVGSLLDKGLIGAMGRLDAPGRPMLYGTTDKFLRVFGLNSLSDLPETDALSAATASNQLAVSPEFCEPSNDTETIPNLDDGEILTD